MDKIILSVGRISPVKNYETLIKAADILVNQKNIRHLRFQIVGGMPLKSQKKYLNSLIDMIKKYKLIDYVHFIGPVPYTQIQNYYQNCELFVSTSNTGSLDKTVLEAMAYGKIVITCNEAFNDVLDNYSQRLIFEKRNEMELAQKINSVLQMDEKFQKELGIDLRNIVIQRHNLDKFADRLVNILQYLIRNTKEV